MGLREMRDLHHHRRHRHRHHRIPNGDADVPWFIATIVTSAVLFVGALTLLSAYCAQEWSRFGASSLSHHFGLVVMLLLTLIGLIVSSVQLHRATRR